MRFLDIEQSLTERYGGSRRARGIWYHGTSSKHVPSILKRGLVPSAKEKGYGADKGGNAMTPDKMSYGGVYLTTNFGTASLAATSVASSQGRKHNPVIIAMSIQPRSLIADEDDVTSLVTSINPPGLIHSAQVASWLMMAAKYAMKSKEMPVQARKDFAKWIREAQQAYIENAMAKIRYRLFGNESDKLHPDFEKRITNLLKATWMPALERAAAYFENEHGSNWKYAWLRNFTDYTNQEPDIDSMPKPPDPAEAEVKFRQHVDQLTKTLKRFAKPKDAGETRRTARYLEPIGFKGSNKIIAIVEEALTDDKKTGMRVLYGTPPQELLDAWEQNIAPVVMVTDNKPRIVFDRWKSE